MMTNNPRMTGTNGEELRPIHKHQTISFDHNGFRCTIAENGKVKLISPPFRSKDNPEENEYDEIEVPAGLIFKVAQFLKATRTTEYVPADSRPVMERG